MLIPASRQIEDLQVVRRRELIKLHNEMESLKQTYLRLDVTYKEQKQEYEKVDKQRALCDGRLHIVKSSLIPKKVENKLSDDQIQSLIEELGNLIK